MKPSFSKRLLGNPRGQFVIEGILLMIVTVSVLIAGTRYVQEQKWMSKLVSGPWSLIAGMIESGVWEDPSAAKAEHPNQIKRHRSPFPKR